MNTDKYANNGNLKIANEVAKKAWVNNHCWHFLHSCSPHKSKNTRKTEKKKIYVSFIVTFSETDMKWKIYLNGLYITSSI